jgi:hypothetical protein
MVNLFLLIPLTIFSSPQYIRRCNQLDAFYLVFGNARATTIIFLTINQGLSGDYSAPARSGGRSITALIPFYR